MLSADTNKSSGVYTCQTCNSLFTCLDIYQKHRRQHAQEEGVKLLTCAHCTYVSDNGFHYNWHIMSHASSPPHRCDVCAPNHQQISKEFPNQNSSIDDNGGNISNGLDCLNESHHDDRNQRISSTIISDDGKRRSIATETSDDLILLSQIYSSPSSSPTSAPFTTTTALTTTNATNHDEDHDDNATIIQASDTEIENDSGEETEEEETAETDLEQSTIDEMNNNNNNQNNQIVQPPICGRNTATTLQQQSFYENDVDDDEDDEEEDQGRNVFNGQNVEQIQYEFIPDPDCIEQQQVDSNGYDHNADIGDNEDDVNEFGNDETQEYDENENFKNNCDTMPPLPPQPTSDVYDFNSDEDLDHKPQQYKLNVSKSAITSAAALAVPNNSTQPSATFNSSTLTNHQAIQLQSFLNASNQGLPIAAAAAAAAAAVANSGGDGAGNATATIPPFLAHPMNANFLFPGTHTSNPFGPSNTSGQHHPHHGPAIFNPAAFATNGPIRLVSIQPFHQTNGNATHPSNAFLPSSAQTNSVTSNNNSMTNLSSTSAGIVNQATLNNHNHFQPNTSNNNTSASKAVLAKKSPKKLPLITSSSTNGLENNSNTLNDSNNVTQTIITPAYQSMKGKGKGNRKPRISFVSVINGITVGADGIRRKFHCSHCGNGKSFKTKSHLQRHMLTHTGEKPYQCQECGAKFNQSSSLRNHIIAIHTKRFPHTCTVCGKGFLMPAVLQKHIQTTGHQSLMTDGTHNSGSTMSEKHEDSSNSDQQQQQMRYTSNLSLQYSDSNNSNMLDEDDDEDQKHEAIMNAMSFIKTEVSDDDDVDEEAENHINFKAQTNQQNRLASSLHVSHLNSTNHAISNSVSALNFASTAMAAQQHQQQQATSTTPSQSNLFFILANSTAS